MDIFVIKGIVVPIAAGAVREEALNLTAFGGTLLAPDVKSGGYL